MKPDFKFYATSTAEKLGKQVAERLGTTLYKTYKEKFSDGELLVRFDDSVRGQVLFIIAKIHMPYENLFELMLTVDAARRSSAKEVILVLPYLPHSRQERRDNQPADGC
jgi:ribose-phosphate pyrophosphokinase